MKQPRFLVLLLVFALSFSSAAWARAVPSAPLKHKARSSKPNLEATRHDLEHAWGHIGAGEKADEFDSEGHAAKAKELINQAYQELRLATQTAQTSNADSAEKK